MVVTENALCVMLTAFVDHEGNDLFVICFIHMKSVIVQQFSRELAFSKKTFKTSFVERWMCLKRSQFECRCKLSHPNSEFARKWTLAADMWCCMFLQISGSGEHVLTGSIWVLTRGCQETSRHCHCCSQGLSTFITNDAVWEHSGLSRLITDSQTICSMIRAVVV